MIYRQKVSIEIKIIKVYLKKETYKTKQKEPAVPFALIYILVYSPILYLYT